MTSRTPRVKLVLNLQEGSTTVQEPDREVVKGIVHACPSLVTQLAVRRYLKEHTDQLTEGAEPADHLAAIAASVGETVLDTCSNDAVAVALTSILQRFLLRIRTEAAAGRLGCRAWDAQNSAAPSQDSADSFALDLQARKAGLRARLTRYADEEKEWHTLLESVRSSSGVASSLVLSECPPEEDAALPGPTPEPDAVGALRTLRSDVHAHMVLQVEGLSMLTADVATLVEGAGAEARAAQREFHQERFRAFSHVDSPARLIQALTQAPLPLPGVEG